MLPVDIEDRECIVRVIVRPAHWDEKKKCLKPAAFLPKDGRSVISVIRQRMGNDFCKEKALELGSGYFGMAVLRASVIRSHGLGVVDRRADYVGHAEIEFPFPAPMRDVPASVDATEKLLEIRRGLVKAAAIFVDDHPGLPTWHGPDLCPDSTA